MQDKIKERTLNEIIPISSACTRKKSKGYYLCITQKTTNTLTLDRISDTFCVLHMYVLDL
jgi:hypothetical protein